MHGKGRQGKVRAFCLRGIRRGLGDVTLREASGEGGGVGVAWEEGGKLMRRDLQTGLE